MSIIFKKIKLLCIDTSKAGVHQQQRNVTDENQALIVLRLFEHLCDRLEINFLVCFQYSFESKKVTVLFVNEKFA